MPLQLLYDYAMRFVGVPYKWGGASMAEGVDCSELVRILLKPYGLLPKVDMTAQGIFNFFKDPREHAHQNPGLGALVFYGKSETQVSHIALCLSPKIQIEAAGGDHTTVTLQRAIEQKACVRITPIRFELDFVACFMPDYPETP